MSSLKTSFARFCGSRISSVPVECDETSSLLPRPPERSGIVLLKLKRKLQFRGHVYFQAVRPRFVLQASQLQWLKANNILHEEIQIDVNNIDTNLTVLHDTDNCSYSVQA